MRYYLLLFIKGMAMGIANIIPGVSGGTIALITKIYEKLNKPTTAPRRNTDNNR